MRNVWLVALLLLACCKEISFQEPQPKGKKALAEVPSSLRGSYLLMDADGKTSDTVVVFERGYRAGHNFEDQDLLSDSLRILFLQ